MAVKLLSDEQRFFRNCEELDSGCWLWKLKLDRDGYGHFTIGSMTDGSRARWSVHRWAYAFFIGKLFSHLTIDHLCRNRACVNPFHLDQVTSRTNTQRGERANATHCKRGHPFAGDNLVFQAEGKRRCKACRDANVKEWRSKNPDKVKAASQKQKLKGARFGLR